METSAIKTVLTDFDTELTRLGLHVYDSRIHLHALDLPMLDVIQEKLNRLTSYTLFLRNSILPINNLPPEILVSVFSALIVMIPDRYKQARRLVALTHVCRHWRILCLDAPLLWTRIYIDLEQYYALNCLCLQRSRSAPLDVTIRDLAITTTCHLPGSVLHSVTSGSEVARIARLDIGVRFHPGLKALTSFQSPAPMLEELAIDVWPGGGQVFSEELVPVLFSGIAPRLRRLTLRQLATVTGSQFHDLTELVLSRQLYWQANLPSLVSLLQASPTLESLSFDRVSLLSDPSPHTKICLPRLKRLFCDGSLADASVVLRLLETPPDAGMVFKTDVDRNISTGESMSLSSESFPLSLPNIAHVTRVNIGVFESCSTVTGTGPSFSFELTFRGSFRTAERHFIVDALCAALRLEEIEELRLLGDTSRVTEYFGRTLGRSTSLSKIVLDCLVLGRASAQFLHKLLPDTVAGNCPCPRLIDLRLLDFDRTNCYHLYEVVESRKQIGLPINTLAVYGPSVTWDPESWVSEVTLLQAQVGTFVLGSVDQLSMLQLAGFTSIVY